jgi:hypothetical protein
MRKSSAFRSNAFRYKQIIMVIAMPKGFLPTVVGSLAPLTHPI